MSWTWFAMIPCYSRPCSQIFCLASRLTAWDHLFTFCQLGKSLWSYSLERNQLGYLYEVTSQRVTNNNWLSSLTYMICSYIAMEWGMIVFITHWWWDSYQDHFSSVYTGHSYFLMSFCEYSCLLDGSHLFLIELTNFIIIFSVYCQNQQTQLVWDKRHFWVELSITGSTKVISTIWGGIHEVNHDLSRFEIVYDNMSPS